MQFAYKVKKMFCGWMAVGTFEYIVKMLDSPWLVYYFCFQQRSGGYEAAFKYDEGICQKNTTRKPTASIKTLTQYMGLIIFAIKYYFGWATLKFTTL